MTTKSDTPERESSARIGRYLYETARAADDAWQAELDAVYGASAANARYDKRGHATGQLSILKLAKLEADYLLLKFLRTK